MRRSQRSTATRSCPHACRRRRSTARCTCCAEPWASPSTRRRSTVSEHQGQARDADDGTIHFKEVDNGNGPALYDHAWMMVDKASATTSPLRYGCQARQEERADVVVRLPQGRHHRHHAAARDAERRASTRMPELGLRRVELWTATASSRRSERWHDAHQGDQVALPARLVRDGQPPRRSLGRPRRLPPRRRRCARGQGADPQELGHCHEPWPSPRCGIHVVADHARGPSPHQLW